MTVIKRVVCGISGGIDSCVSALLLKRKGFEVVGVFMRNWDHSDETGKCQASKDAEDAENVCKKLEIPFHETGFVKEYWNEVFTPLLQDYQNGLTPNPDVLCNRFIKFRSFLDYAREKHGADAIATGHYARNSYGTFLENKTPNTPASLLRGVDRIKDQTLFLSQISQDALQHTMFPVGDVSKAAVRRMAKIAKFKELIVKPESTGICFIGKRNFADFMKEYVQPRPGKFIDVDTHKLVGRHDGIQLFTLGQRALISGATAPYFIAHKNPQTNDIFVALGHDNPLMYSKTCAVSGMHWISGLPRIVDNQFECDFRFQHATPTVPCVVTLDPKDPANLTVALSCTQFAVTPGQYAVLYKGEVCLGSGRIVATEVTKILDDMFAFRDSSVNKNDMVLRASA